MIVAFDLERDRPAVADIDHAGVFFAGFDQDVWPGGGEFLQLSPRVLVGAVLAPHDREDAELGEVRFAPEDLLDALEFLRGEPVFRDQIGRDRRIGRWRQKSGDGHAADLVELRSVEGRERSTSNVQRPTLNEGARRDACENSFARRPILLGSDRGFIDHR